MTFAFLSLSSPDVTVHLMSTERAQKRGHTGGILAIAFPIHLHPLAFNFYATLKERRSAYLVKRSSWNVSDISFSAVIEMFSFGLTCARMTGQLGVRKFVVSGFGFLAVKANSLMLFSCCRIGRKQYFEILKDNFQLR